MYWRRTPDRMRKYFIITILFLIPQQKHMFWVLKETFGFTEIQM